MENEQKAPEPDLYDREEACSRAIRSVLKACFMRLLVVGLMIFVLLSEKRPLWLWGLIGLVLLMNLAGMLPLTAELKKRLRERKELRAQEET